MAAAAYGGLAAPPIVAQEFDARSIPEPAAILGFRPGEDRALATWEQFDEYCTLLAERSDRVNLDTLGRSTLDRPLLMLTISDPENLGQLERIRRVQAKLADPRRLASNEERADLISTGRLVVAITAGVHGVEVAGPLAALRLAHRLAIDSDPEVRRVLREVIVLLVPAVNPDGLQAVAEWYRDTIDMPWEGTIPPFPDHHYVGHDLNRDWYFLSQRETGELVAGLHEVWHPQIVLDIHQQDPYGSRFFVPPWVDPIDPNVDPRLIAATTALGSRVAWGLIRSGRTGVVIHSTYDAWTPSRGYPLYHGAVRILAEAASARLATPVVVAADELRGGPDFDPRTRSWNFPAPWRGGRWSLEDAIGYIEDAALHLLNAAAADRAAWLANFVSVGEEAVRGRAGWPDAWILRPGSTATEGVAELLRILILGGVEVGRSRGPIRAGDREYPSGGYVIDMHQPYAAFVQTLLERQQHPQREGAVKESAWQPPYDVTAHTLPLLFGVRAESVRGTIQADTVGVSAVPPTKKRIEGLSAAPGLLVGLYQPYVPAPDEGWTRWLFDTYSIPYATLHNEDLRQGSLANRFTVIVIPSAPAEVLRDGWEEGSLPRRYTGGLAGQADTALRAFVVDGGTVVALNAASRFVIEALGLPVRDLLEGVAETEYSAAGAIVSLEVDTLTALGRGMPPRTAAWVEGGSAFALTDATAGRVVARYGSGPTLLSGWMIGAQRLAGKPAVLEVRLGQGRVVLFGFRPQYRGHSLVTFPLLFNALRPAGTTLPGQRPAR